MALQYPWKLIQTYRYPGFTEPNEPVPLGQWWEDDIDVIASLDTIFGLDENHQKWTFNSVAYDSGLIASVVTPPNPKATWEALPLVYPGITLRGASAECVNWSLATRIGMVTVTTKVNSYPPSYPIEYRNKNLQAAAASATTLYGVPAVPYIGAAYLVQRLPYS